MTAECRHVKIPIWAASIVGTAILGLVINIHQTVDRMDIELRCLRTELKTKGIIAKSEMNCDSSNTKMMNFDGVSGYSAYPAN